VSRRRGDRVRRSKLKSPPRLPAEPLEQRLMMAATAYPDSFNVTDLSTLRTDYPAITGAGVAIAVLDTGVDIANPDLTGQVEAYYNAVEDAVPTTAPGTTGAADNDGHGTHVSGIAASANPDIGVAYGAKLVDVKVIADSGEQQLSGDPLLRGLEFVAQYASTYNIKVVNLSLGEATSSGGINDNTVPAADDISTEIGVLEGMGITVVAASGNSYANDPAPGESYPAVVSTIGVANTFDDSGTASDFDGYAYGTAEDSYAAVQTSATADQFNATSQRSTLGNQVVAPGTDIYSDWNGTSTGNGGSDLLHNTLSGTSMSTPFVSGLVALMQQAAFTYGGRYITDPEEVLNIIRETADVIPDPNVAGDYRIPIEDGEYTGGPEQPLDGTGDTYDRVNVLHAIEAVQQLFTGTVSNVDIDDTTATATTVPTIDGNAVETETGDVGTDGLNDVGAEDVDLYAVTLTTVGTLTAALSAETGGTSFVADVRIFDAGGNEIAAAVGTSASGYPTITAGTSTDPLAAGTYYVGVSSAGNAAYTITGAGSNETGATGGTGDYQLSLSLSNPDPNGVVQGAVAVDLTDPNYTIPGTNTVANEQPGTLGSDPAPTGSTGSRVSVPNGDVDMFAVVAPDTGTVNADVDAIDAASEGVAGADSFVEVFSESASGATTVLASDGVASAGASNSEVTFDVTIGQTYYVAVTVDANKSFSPTDPYDRVTGSTATPTDYDLILTFNNGNTNGTALLATAATVGTTEAGDIGSTVAGMGADGGFKYVNWYTYTPTASGLLDLTATATSGGFSPNVQLWTLSENADGSVGITEVAGVTGSGQSLVDSVTAAQAVYVSVTGEGNSNFNWYSLGSGSGGQTGTYALASSIISPTSETAVALNDNSVDYGTPGTLTTAAPVAGDIGMDGGLVVGDTDVDLYKFVPTVSGAYDLRTNTSQEGSADTYLRLFDASGNQIDANDNADSTTEASYIRADLTAGVTYYLGVSGTGNENYDPITGAGTTDSTTSGVYTLSAALATLPAITIATPAAVSPTAAGATLAFVVSLDQPSTSAVTVDYATADGTAVAGTDYSATTGTLTFAAGQTTQTIDVPVLLDPNITGTVTFTVDLSSPSGNALLDGGQATGTITDLPVSQLPFSSGTRATYIDNDGHRVTVTLSGPGSGVVSVVGTDGSTEQVTLATTDTTARTHLTIASAGGDTTLDGLAVTGSLGTLAAATVNLAGDLTVTGTITTLTLAGASGGHTLSVAGTGATGSLKLGDVSDLTVAVAEPLATLSASAWANPSDDDVITAPSIRLLTVSGAFSAGLAVGDGGTALQAVRIGGAVSAGAWKVDGSIGTLAVGSTAAGWSAEVSGSITAMTVNGSAAGSLTAASVRSLHVKSNLSGATIALTAAGATDLATLTVGGTIDDSTIRATGSVGTVRAAAMTGSALLAGVSPSVTGQPTSAADFAAAADIVSFTVTGLPGGATSFADSDVAAATLGRVSVRDIDTANGGVPFGFAGETLASFTDAEAGVATFRWTPKDPASRLTFNGDLAVRVLGTAT
jgi:hypothetical protein